MASNHTVPVQPVGDMEHAVRSFMSIFRTNRNPVERPDSRRVPTSHGANCMCHRHGGRRIVEHGEVWVPGA
jgi:hypothetical protein